MPEMPTEPTPPVTDTQLLKEIRDGINSIKFLLWLWFVLAIVGGLWLAVEAQNAEPRF